MEKVINYLRKEGVAVFLPLLLGCLFGIVVGLSVISPHMYLAPDSFIYFTMARQFHDAGLLFSFTGVDHTTGLHPGYYFLILPLYPLFALDMPSWSFIVNGFLLAASLFIFYRIFGIVSATIVGFLLLVPYGFSLVNNGMESSGALLGLALTTFFFLRYQKNNTASRAVFLGLSLALMVFFRLDLVFVAIALYAVWGLQMLLQYKNNEFRGTALYHAAISLVPLGSILCVVFFQNYFFSGHILPISGSIKSSLPSIDPAWLGKVVSLKLYALALVTMLAYLTVTFFRKGTAQTSVIILFFGCVLQYGYNVMFASGIGAWYGTFPYFCLLIVIAYIFERTKVNPLFAGILCIGATTLVINSHVNNGKEDWITPHREAAEFLGLSVTDVESAGEMKDGVFAFYARFPVYSMTGLANNYEYVEALRTGTIDEYLESRKIAYIAAGEIWSGVQVRGYETLFSNCKNPVYNNRFVEIYRIADCNIK